MKNFKSLKITLFIFSLVLMPLSFFNHTTYAKEDIALDEQEYTNFTLSNIDSISTEKLDNGDYVMTVIDNYIQKILKKQLQKLKLHITKILQVPFCGLSPSRLLFHITVVLQNVLIAHTVPHLQANHGRLKAVLLQKVETQLLRKPLLLILMETVQNITLIEA